VGEPERLLRRLGGVAVPCRRHLVYVLAGHRFTLQRGTRTNPRELTQVRSVLRRLGLL
jgi:hypothetical protein